MERIKGGDVRTLAVPYRQLNGASPLDHFTGKLQSTTERYVLMAVSICYVSYHRTFLKPCFVEVFVREASAGNVSRLFFYIKAYDGELELF